MAVRHLRFVFTRHGTRKSDPSPGAGRSDARNHVAWIDGRWGNGRPRRSRSPPRRDATSRWPRVTLANERQERLTCELRRASCARGVVVVAAARFPSCSRAIPGCCGPGGRLDRGAIHRGSDCQHSGTQRARCREFVFFRARHGRGRTSRPGRRGIRVAARGEPVRRTKPPVLREDGGCRCWSVDTLALAGRRRMRRPLLTERSVCSWWRPVPRTLPVRRVTYPHDTATKNSPASETCDSRFIGAVKVWYA